MHKSNLTKLYIQNRNDLFDLLENNSITIIESNHETFYNLDSSYNYYQNSDLIYLTGVTQPNTVLILLKKNNEKNSILFVDQRTKQQEIWIGKLLSKEEIQKLNGIQQIEEIKNIKKYLKKIDKDYNIVNFIKDEKFKNLYSCKSYEILTWIKTNLPNKKYVNITNNFNQLRSIKKPIEIEFIKNACNATISAFKKIIKNIKPTINEREIQGYFYYNLKKEGVDDFAYPPIVASGKNSCTLHYIQNNHILKKNDLILLDIGGRKNNYCADITRVFPVNKKFTSYQKEVYQHVYNILTEIKNIIKPNLSFSEYKHMISKIFEAHLLDLKLINKNDIGKNIYKNYTIHGVSHHLGLDVHDRGLYDKIKPGMVMTVEPGLYIPNKNIGIRLEDDILVNHNGIECLTRDLDPALGNIYNLIAN